MLATINPQSHQPHFDNSGFSPLPLMASTALAAFTTAGLFYVMQTLVSFPDGVSMEERYIRPIVEFTIPKVTEVKRKKRVVEPPEYVSPPITDPLPPTHVADGPIDIPTVAPPKPTEDFPTDIFNPAAASDGEMVPIVRVNPIYPTRAAERGIEGTAVVEFTVDAAGFVVNPVIIEEDPAGYFASSTLKAIQKFRYKPKVVDGKAYPTHNVRFRMVYNLSE